LRVNQFCWQEEVERKKVHVCLNVGMMGGEGAAAAAILGYINILNI